MSSQKTLTQTTAPKANSSLSSDEVKELKRCERLIAECDEIMQEGSNTDYKRAKALTTIHDQRLYRQSHKRFERYCAERLNIKKSHAHRLLNYYKIFCTLRNAKVRPLPVRERQTREITDHLPADKWLLAWDRAVDASGNKPVTSPGAKTIVDQLRTELRSHRRRRFGEPMDFEGLRHEPINELGVVFLFGIISKRLGFTVESVQSGFPDCLAKRVADSRRGQLEQVEIEFEYESRTFLKHRHDCKRCDLLVCWIHNWPECPIPVLELKEEVRRLSAGAP